MPGFNQRGPMGKGPMTGRRMGRCTNFGAKTENQTESQSISDSTQNFNSEIGRGCGAGRGLGKGRGMGIRRQNRFRGGQ